MLKNTRNNKLKFLRILLYIIIFLIFGITINQGIGIYKSISLLSANKLSAWLSHNIGDDYQISIDEVKTIWKNFNIYVEINNINIQPTVVNHYNAFKVKQITGQINILKIILAGKIKVKNLLAKDIQVTFNNLHKKQTINEVWGIIKINFINGLINKLNIRGDFKLPNMNFITDLVVRIQNNQVKFTKFKFSCYESDTKEVIKYLPESFIDSKILGWLDSAILSGLIKNADLILDLKNDFLLNISFKKIMLKYAADWPLIEDLDANLKISNDNLEIVMIPGVSSGMILKQPITKLVAKMQGISLENNQLYIHGKINTPIEYGVKFLNLANPLKLIGKNLEKLSLQGKMEMVIDLSIPMGISNPEENINYYGNLQIKQGNLKFLNLKMNEIMAKIKFSDRGISTEKFEGKILDIPSKIDFTLDDREIIFNSNLLNFKIPFSENLRKNFWSNNGLTLIIPELSLLNQKLFNLKLINDSNQMKIYLDEKDFKGTISYQKSIPEEYYLEIDKLKINLQQLNNINGFYKLLWHFLSNLKFDCKQLYINEINFGKVNFNVRSVNNKDGQNLSKKIQFTDLSVETQNIYSNAVLEVDFNYPEGILKGILSGSINSSNFGGWLRELNVNSKLIANGKGHIDFNVEFLINEIINDIKKIEILDLVADLQLDIKSGFILGFDPGIGKILGLLNIENIPRRLSFDFRDLTNQGFYFDLLKGKLAFNQDQLKLDNIIIKGPSANIILNGNTSIISKKLDLIAAVSGKTGATFPLAAAVAAGNPVIGAAFWLFDHASGSKFSEIKVKKYQINGNWDQPKVTTLK